VKLLPNRVQLGRLIQQPAVCSKCACHKAQLRRLLDRVSRLGPELELVRRRAPQPLAVADYSVWAYRRPWRFSDWEVSRVRRLLLSRQSERVNPLISASTFIHVNRANLRPIRLAVAILTIGFCLFFIQVTARIGFSRLLSRYALISNSIPAVEQAIRLRPSDPDAHRARAAVFNRLRMPTEATKSLETAVSLRYRDDYLWLELGNSREELGDVDGALEAFDQAVRWAPYYAHPRWQRGNLLLRTNRPSEVLFPS
jgi:tetratricopeptide (TPR) repeat protein